MTDRTFKTAAAETENVRVVFQFWFEFDRLYHTRNLFAGLRPNSLRFWDVVDHELMEYLMRLPRFFYKSSVSQCVF